MSSSAFKKFWMRRDGVAVSVILCRSHIPREAPNESKPLSVIRQWLFAPTPLMRVEPPLHPHIVEVGGRLVRDLVREVLVPAVRLGLDRRGALGAAHLVEQRVPRLDVGVPNSR